MGGLRQLRHLVYLPLRRSFLKLASDTHRPQGAGGEVRRILVPQPHNSLGDLVLSIPFLDEVHRLWPRARIDLVVGEAMTDLFAKLPYVDKVVPYRLSRLRAPLARYQDTARLRSICGRLDASYDLALDPRWDSDAFAYLARAASFLSGAPLRAAYSGLVDGKEPWLDGFLTHRALGGNGEHELVRKLRMLERAGLSPRRVEDAVRFESSASLAAIAQAAAASLAALLREAGMVCGQPYAVLAPSASAVRRIWPIESLIEVARALGTSFGFQFVVTGGAKDIALCERVVAELPGRAISLAGKTNVPQLCALLAGTALFIGNDSGPAHIAGLLGSNTVIVSVFPASLNGLDHVNAPGRFGPGGPRVRVIQPDSPLRPCRNVCVQSTAHCIEQVGVDTVLSACRELLDTAANASGG